MTDIVETLTLRFVFSKSDFHKYSSKFLKGRSAGFKMNRYLLLPDESGDEGGPCARL